MSASDLGVVVIGRNEGDRLTRCLRSLANTGYPVVYVDSGSTDGSAARAQAEGAQLLELDTSLPLSAARGRNEGFAALLDAHPRTRFVQFVDGDCEVFAGWLELARQYLEAHSDVGVVCGRRRERFRNATPYNRLADMEWDTPIGATHACGGDALMRAAVVREVGGYDAELIAGEDPELCMRIRRAGLHIVRLDRDMTLHDANLTHFSQWWRRQVRSGHAYAELVHRARGRTEAQFIRQLRSILCWGGALPALALSSALLTGGLGLLLLAGLPLLALRIYRRRRSAETPTGEALLYSAACAVGKLAEFQGVLTYAWNRFALRRSTDLMEYKDDLDATEIPAAVEPRQASEEKLDA